LQYEEFNNDTLYNTIKVITLNKLKCPFMESRHFRFVQMVSISVQPFSGKKRIWRINAAKPLKRRRAL